MKKNNNNSKNKRIIIISIILICILFILSIFGCKKYNDNKYRLLLSSIPKLNDEGYWIDKDNNKLTDLKANNKNINSYDYYKNVDKDYQKPLSTFINEFNNKTLNHKFKVNFYLDDNIEYDIQEYNFLDKLVFPKDPIKNNYNFEGWKLLDNNLNDNLLFNSNNKIIVDSNFKFKAIFNQEEVPYKDTYKVEFYVDNNLYKEFEVKKGEIIGDVKAPEKEGYIYQGWYYEYYSKSIKFEPEKDIVTRDYVLKAKYYPKKIYEESNKYTVNIYDHNHNIVSSNIYELDTEIELKRYSNDYVYEYYYEEDNTIDKFDTIKDEDYFSFVVTKNINLIPKGHKKFIKFICEDADLSIVNSNGHSIDDGIVNVSTGSSINFAKVAKPNFYRVHKVIWQIDNNGVREDYNDTIYNSKYDLTLYYKEDPDMFEDIVLIEEDESQIKVVGLNEPYKSTPDYKLTIPALINDKEVTNISGLNRNNNLKEVVLPNTVKYIGKEAFDLNQNLEKINLEDTKVEIIDDYAFRFCNKLETINFPSTLKSINEYAFQFCKFENLDFSSTNLENISKEAFFALDELTDVKLPSTLKTIGDKAFGGCDKLENINLEDTSVSSIGSEAFVNNKELKNIKLPSSCTSLGEMCFHGCFKLEKADFSSSNVVNIPKSCFYWCGMLKEVLLPSNLTTISDKAFRDCNKLENISFENTKLVSIGEEAFQWCYQLKSIKLPATFKFLSKASFLNCINMLYVDLSLTHVESISRECFSYCEKIKTVLLPSSITTIKYNAFYCCEELETINLFDTSVETIEECGFGQCNSIKNIKLPSSLKTIGKSGFEVCMSALSIDLSLTSIENIEENTFYFANKVKIIKFPSTIKSIGKKAFAHTKVLDVIEFDGTEAEFRAINIDPYAFEYIATNPEIKFNNGTSIHFSDL